MRNPRHRRLIWLLLAGALIGAPASAQVLGAVGKIIKVRPPGAARVLDAPGGPREAHYGDLLYGGERFEIARDGLVIVNLGGRDVEYRAGADDLVVPARRARAAGKASDDYVRGFERFIRQPRRTIVAFPYARADQEASAGPPARPDPILPLGEQFVLPGARTMGLVWRDSSTTLILKSGSTTQALSSDDQAWMVAPAPAAPGWSIASRDGRLAWTVTTAARAPAPAWLASKDALSDDERLVRAIWILREAGAVRWRLFALGELAELAAGGDFVADQTWSAVRSGEWMEWIAADASGQQ